MVEVIHIAGGGASCCLFVPREAQQIREIEAELRTMGDGRTRTAAGGGFKSLAIWALHSMLCLP